MDTTTLLKDYLKKKVIEKIVLQKRIDLFIRKTFYSLNSSSKYIHNWHIDLISEYLEEVYCGNIKRLIINMPPRYLKSICVSVAFPAWILGKDPSSRIIVASYSEKLSIKHSTDCRLIVTSKWYKKTFPDFKLNKTQNEKYKFATTKNGFRFATSVGGTLTGEGGNYLIIDDPHNPQQAMSNKLRKKTLNWFSNTFSSRLDDKKKGVIILIMQRLHPNDLTGYLLEKMQGLWHHLSIPVLAEKDKYIPMKYGLKKRKKGDLLHPEREGVEEINRMKLEMGNYVFSAQYQQKPLLIKAGMMNPQWIKRYKKEEIKLCNKITLSFDTAIKKGEKNDPTVCTIWKEYENNYYLVDVYRDWLEYPKLKKIAHKLISKWKPEQVLIEDKSSGQSLIQDLKKETKYPILAIKVSKDKITRFAAITAMIEAGQVYLPFEADWLTEFENELYTFPNSKHDDQVDSITQFLDWTKNRPYKNKRKAMRRI